MEFGKELKKVLDLFLKTDLRKTSAYLAGLSHEKKYEGGKLPISAWQTDAEKLGRLEGIEVPEIFQAEFQRRVARYFKVRF